MSNLFLPQFGVNLNNRLQEHFFKNEPRLKKMDMDWFLITSQFSMVVCGYICLNDTLWIDSLL